MTSANAKTKVVLEATITRADGTEEDLGIISQGEELPEWFQRIKSTEEFQQLKEKGVIENG